MPQVDWARIDATTEEEIAAQIGEDEAEAMRNAAAYARCVRRKVGLSQVAFAKRIGVPVDTVRNWEQGKRAPQDPAPALLRIIDRDANSAAPEFPLEIDRKFPHPPSAATARTTPARSPNRSSHPDRCRSPGGANCRRGQAPLLWGAWNIDGDT